MFFLFEKEKKYNQTLSKISSHRRLLHPECVLFNVLSPPAGIGQSAVIATHGETTPLLLSQGCQKFSHESLVHALGQFVEGEPQAAGAQEDVALHQGL